MSIAAAPFSDVVVGTAPVQLLSASRFRVAIIFSAPTGGRVTLSPGTQPTLDKGLTIQPGDPPLKLHVLEYG